MKSILQPTPPAKWHSGGGEKIRSAAGRAPARMRTPARECYPWGAFYRGGMVMSIAVGSVAPDFTLKDQSQKEVKLSEFAGKKNVVLVFYPLDWSPTCTNEHACLVNDMKAFETLDAEVLGVSVDSVWSHKAYAEKMGIGYSLLADFQPRGAMSEKYGVYMPEKGITGRSIIIVNKAGKIAWAKDYDIPVVPDLKEVATALQQVKSAAA
jgi:mycoredoxin-dependent peroxiredoxin